jgi:hypothetical protein
MRQYCLIEGAVLVFQGLLGYILSRKVKGVRGSRFQWPLKDMIVLVSLLENKALIMSSQ